MTNSQLTMYITLVTTSGVLSVFLFIYAYIRRAEMPGSRIYLLYTAAQVVYIFGFAFELASETMQEVKFWTTVEYAGMPFAPVLGLLLVLRYTGRPVSGKAAAAMLVIPFLSFALVATNDWHHLFYKSVFFRETGPSSLVDIEAGQWYIVHGAYTFGCLLAGAVLLLRQWNRTNEAYRLQLTALIAGQFVPMIAAFLYLMNATPAGSDPVPIVMCFTSAMYIWAIISTRTFTIVPIAKERLFESMREGVLVLDASGRLVDYNAAVGRMIPALHASMIGRKLDEAWTQMTGEAFPIDLLADGTQDELTWAAKAEISYYQVRSSTVRLRNGERAGSLLMLIDVTEQKRMQRQLEQQAYYDGLTGIFNRAQLLHRSKKMLDEARSRNEPVSFILFDIDRFKRVNDTYGHDTGDRLIVHVVSVCRQHLPHSALFARYGGEEFVIVLPNAALEDAGALAERIRTVLEAAPMPTTGGPLAVTASFGAAAALSATGGGDSLESVLRDADAALYESKRNGRNKVSLHRRG